MIRKHVRTWLLRGGIFCPTPDTLFVSPEHHELLGKFPQRPHASAEVVDGVREFGDGALSKWFVGESPSLLMDQMGIGNDGNVLLPGLIPPLPYADFGYFIKQGGLLGHAVQVFDLIRTMDVAQLSFLTAPLTTEPGSPRRRFTHSRYVHMLDVAVLLILITEQLRNELTALAPSLGFPPGEAGFISLRNTLVTAGAIHDALTVAGGDGVKFIDEVAFDEDRLIALLMAMGKYKIIFFKTWSINKTALRLTIRGYPKCSGKKQRYHLLNHILDYADKLAYTSRDAWQYVQRMGSKNEISSLVTEDPQVCSLWKSVGIAKGKFVCTDHERLGRFLRLRVLMFHHLYHDLEARGGEAILGRVICGYMYRRGMLNMFNLLGNTDSWLGAQIAQLTGLESAVDRMSEAVMGYGPFDAATDAHLALRSGNDRGMLMFVEGFKNQTNSGTGRFFTPKDGKFGTFAEMYPEEAAVVDRVHESHQGFRGYSLDLRSLAVHQGVEGDLRGFALRESSK